MALLALALVFACACTNDVLACAWHRAREDRARARGAALAALLELVQWFPVLLALDARVGIYDVITASVAGSMIGSMIGFRRRA